MSKKYDFSDFDQPAASKYDFSDFENSPEVSELESGLRGLAQGTTLGFSDEITGAIESLLSEKSYEQSRNEARKNNQLAREQNPYSYGAGEIGGSVATAFVPGLNTAKLGSLSARVAANAGLGGLAGLGLSDADNALDLAKDTATSAALGGGLTYGIEKAAPYISKGAQLAKQKITSAGKGVSNLVDDTILPKFGKMMNNIPEDMTQEYIQKKGILPARTTEEIMDELVGYNTSASSKLDESKFGYDRAKELFNETKLNAKNELVDAKYNTQNLLSEARDAYRNKVTTQKEAFKNFNVQELRENIGSAIEQLKENVSKGSSDAYNVLSKQKGSVDIGNALYELDNGLADLTINGQTISDSATQSFQNLSKLKERLSGLGNEISFPQAKQILQQLDDDIKVAASKGSFAPEADAVKSRVRRSLDSVLKSVSPDYKKLMSNVADDTQLLSEMSSGFGTDTKIINRLNQLASEKGRQIDLPLLQKLGQKTGNDFDSTLNKYIQTQDLVNSPTNFQKYTEGFDEFKNLDELQQYYSKLKDPNNVRRIEELQSVQKAQRGLSDAEAFLNQSKEDYDLFRNVAPGVVENKIKSMNGARQYGANDLFDKINAKTGKNYTEEIRNRAILDSFEKSDTNGSRKTLVGALIGGPIGGALGFAGDKFAGKTFKAILDGRVNAPEAIAKIAPRLGKYAQPLLQAAKNGNQSLAATMFILQQNHPDFRQKMKELEQE